MSYLFGNSDIAEQRLRVLAEVFQESTRPFLLDTNLPEDSTAVDLGCGLGYSTHLFADHLPCQRVVGMDNSHHSYLLRGKQIQIKSSFVYTTLSPYLSPSDPVTSSFAVFSSHILKILRPSSKNDRPN